MSVKKRLAVLQKEAADTPVPARKYFHIGKLEDVDGVGECIPMMAWADDNLSRYVLADAPSNVWGARPVLMRCLPNLVVKKGEGVFIVTGAGEDRSEPHPSGGGHMHFVHLGRERTLADDNVTRIHLYRLEGVQVKQL
jgi:hypothetical protein